MGQHRAPHLGHRVSAAQHSRQQRRRQLQRVLGRPRSRLRQLGARHAGGGLKPGGRIAGSKGALRERAAQQVGQKQR